ncbi:MAG TPA: FN3 associated domain-containing protein [Fibrobacteria bacterium]|nr:FN3 associated domain-containing protein [Fibrobacteria bacterium]
MAEGTNFQDVVAFDTEHCVFAAKKVAINWSKAPPPPPDTVKSVTANPPSKTSRDPITVSLSTTTSGATIWYTLDGADPKPGQTGTLKYQGAIVIGKDSVTLKAVATKADHISSGITTEKYAILPFRMVDVKAALLLDRGGKALDGSNSTEYRDGYADILALVLDRGDGDVDESQALAQLNAATLTGGFKLVSGSLAAALKAISGDTLYLPLETNTQAVDNGSTRLTLALPTGITPNDGMLPPGAYPVRDAIAPVLRSAVLRLHEQFGGTAPDTLVVVFSEPLVKSGQTSTAPLQGKLFGLLDVSVVSAGALASDSAAAQYAFTVGVGESRQTNLANVGEAAYAFLLTASSNANGATVAAQAGDWIWIDPAAGLKDTSSNAQTSPKNRWVLLRIAHPLNLKVGPTVDGGVSHLSSVLPSADDPTWSTVADGTNEFGSGDVRIQVRDKANPSQYGGIAVDATAPFKVFARVFSNLGVSATDIRLEVGEADFARLPVNPDGSRRLNLLWNGRAKSGQLVGTGAYVYSWQVSGIDDEGIIRSTKDQRIYGIMRGQ